MKPILFTTLVIIAGALVANTICAQTPLLPDDVRRALPVDASAEPESDGLPVSATTKLAADPDSSDELLKQALLRYQNIALQSDVLTEQFLNELNERIDRLEAKLTTTHGPSQQQPDATQPAATDQSVAQLQMHDALRPMPPQATTPAVFPESVTAPVDVSNSRKDAMDSAAPPIVKSIVVARGSKVPADSADELDDIANVFEATADSYEQLANQFRQHADGLRRRIRDKEPDLHK